MTAVLHTWNQQLEYHVHLHCIIAGGALALDGSRWLPAPPHLFDIDALSRAYRAHFLAALRRAHRREELVLPGCLAEAGPIRGDVGGRGGQALGLLLPRAV